MSGLKRWTPEEVIKACRFCLMCRHVCSVGNATLRESDTPRGKALLLYSKLAGIDVRDDECATAVYNCALCYRCLENCVGAFDLPETILSTRRELAADDLLPVEVRKLRAVAIAEATNEAYGERQGMRAEVEAAIGCLPDKENVLLFGGTSTPAYAPGAVEGAARVLSKAGVTFTMLAQDCGSGYELLEMGFWQDAAKVAESIATHLTAVKNDPQGHLTVITLDPSDGWALGTLYRKLGVDIRAEVIDFASYASRLVEAGRISFRPYDCVVTYHDPCHLARVQRVFEPPRRLLNSVPALVVREPFFTREQALCCGGHLRAWNPGVARSIAARSLRELKETGASRLVTSCPVCCSSFREVAPELDIVHLAEFLGNLVA